MSGVEGPYLGVPIVPEDHTPAYPARTGSVSSPMLWRSRAYRDDRRQRRRLTRSSDDHEPKRDRKLLVERFSARGQKVIELPCDEHPTTSICARAG